MRYLILANNSGGLYRFRKEIITELVNQGNAVYVSTPFDTFVDELRALGITVIEQVMNRRGTNPLQEANVFFSYRTLIKQLKPDYIITYTIKPGIYGGMWARHYRIPYAVNITGLGTAFQKKGVLLDFIVRLWKCALKKANVVFFENQGNANVFLEYNIISTNQVKTLNGAGVNMVDFPFADYPKETDETRLLFVGRVMHEKGVDELLAAVEHLHDAGYKIHLDVVGPYEENYETRLQQLEKRGLLTFYGYQKDVRPYIIQAHVFVLPSYHEGMANTLLECAAMGRPLITTRIHGCMEAVVENETGFLCEVANVDSLVAQLERFLNLPYEKRKEMGKHAHEHIARNYDKQNIVQETLATLTEFCTAR